MHYTIWVKKTQKIRIFPYMDASLNVYTNYYMSLANWLIYIVNQTFTCCVTLPFVLFAYKLMPVALKSIKEKYEINLNLLSNLGSAWKQFYFFFQKMILRHLNPNIYLERIRNRRKMSHIWVSVTKKREKNIR